MQKKGGTSMSEDKFEFISDEEIQQILGKQKDEDEKKLGDLDSIIDESDTKDNDEKMTDDMLEELLSYKNEKGKEEKVLEFKGAYLFSYLQEHLKNFRKMGIMITEIVALAVTVAGRKTLQRFRFKEVNTKENIFIYNAEKNEALFIIEGQHFEALYTTIGKLLKVKWRSF